MFIYPDRDTEQRAVNTEHIAPHLYETLGGFLAHPAKSNCCRYEPPLLR